MSFVGCGDDDDDSGIKKEIEGLKDRLSNLEKLCETFNADIVSLKTVVTALQNNDYITGYSEMADGSGVMINFYKGGTIIIKHGADGKDGANGLDGKDGKDGKDGVDGSDAPIIGIALYEGVYYWTMTIDGETDWLFDDEGNKLRVTGENGKDGQDGKDGEKGEKGDSMFNDVTQDDNYVYFELSDGTVISIPKETEFGINFDEFEEIGITAGGTREINFTIIGATDNVIVKVITQNGWKATSEMTSRSKGTITAIAPDPLVEDEIIVLVNDGKDKTLLRSIDFVTGTVSIVNSMYENLPATGGEYEVELRTNLSYNVSIDEDAQSWISLSQKRAYRTDFLTFVIAENEDDERFGFVRLKDDAGNVLESIFFSQIDGRGDTYVGDLTLSTEADLIKVRDAAFSKVTGNVTVSGSTLTTLQRLNNQITEITGDLILNCSSLTTLDGLYGLTEIGGDFKITNAKLTSFEGINELQKIGGDFSITATTTSIASLSSFEGLEKLELIGGNFNIISSSSNYSSPSLNSLETFVGLRSLKTIGGNFIIKSTASNSATSLNSLESFEGLSSLVSIGGDFLISSSSNSQYGSYSSSSLNSLKTFDGLNSLVFIGGDFLISSSTISSNSASTTSLHSLESFEGLSSLVSIGGDFSINSIASQNSTISLPTIYSLHSLKSFDGLNSLVSIGGNFSINSSSSYSSSYSLYSLESFDGLSSLASIGGDLSINSSASYSDSYSLYSLESFDGLNNLNSINGDFIITASGYSLRALSSFEGLEKLNSIGGDFTITASSTNGLTSLTSFEGFNIQHIGGKALYIQRLNALNDISSLSSIRTVMNDIQFLNCTNLSDFCPIKDLVQDMGNGSFYSVGCGYNPTKQQILNGQCSLQ